GSLLIMDEVITGFRAAYGGVQTRCHITPDLTTLGKIIGGGLPVGAFGGKEEYMRRVAPSGDVYQAGTLSGNPLAMTAGLATLKILKTSDYAALEARVAAFTDELHAILQSKGVPVQITRLASMFTVFFNSGALRNFEDVKKSDTTLLTRYFKGMREHNIFTAPSAFETGMVSFAHTSEDFTATLEAAKRIAL
ncbi:MAG: aminotransferase class III-fold pyridoxal phosphate-dependent enzyme, partial [Bilophila sp.]